MKINLKIKIKCEFTFIFLPEMAAESECFLSGSLSFLWEMESFLEEEKYQKSWKDYWIIRGLKRIFSVILEYSVQGRIIARIPEGGGCPIFFIVEKVINFYIFISSKDHFIDTPLIQRLYKFLCKFQKIDTEYKSGYVLNQPLVLLPKGIKFKIIGTTRIYA